jgi:hypothetical protein
MITVGEDLGAYLTADNIALALAIVGTVLFSALAARVQARLWKKTLHLHCRRRLQQFITEGRGRLR